MDGDENEIELPHSHSQPVTGDNFKNLYLLVEAVKNEEQCSGIVVGDEKQQVPVKISSKRKNTLDAAPELPKTKKPFANNKFSPLFVEDDFNNLLDNISVKKVVQQQAPVEPAAPVGKKDKPIPKPKSSAKSGSSQSDSAKFCPPIFIENVNLKALIAKLSEKLKKDDFKIKNISNNRSKLYIRCPFVHSEIMAMFKSKEISSYSFTPVQLRQTRLILRGLVRNTDVSDLIEELEIRAPGIVDEVTPFSTKYSRDNNIMTGLFLVVLRSGYSASSVAHIKQIAHQVVKWEKPYSSNKIVQCKRCQKWGHIARNCNRPYVCVKCDKDHLPGECSLSKDMDTKPFCANCRSWGHPASFSGCPSYTNFKNLRAGLNNPKDASVGNKSPSKKVNSQVVGELTYAAAVKKGEVNPGPSVKQQCPGFIKEFLDVAMFILNESESLENRILKFLKSIPKLSPAERKTRCIALLREVQIEYDV